MSKAQADIGQALNRDAYDRYPPGPTVTLEAEQVADYLRRHPEFFVDHDELIPEMRIPHQPGDAVSLVERQVRLLRERNIEMRHRLSQLMDVARDNDRLFDKTRRLVLDLLDATSLEEIVSTVEDSLRHEFLVPYVSLILFSDNNLPVGRSVSSAEAHQAIGGLLSGGKTVCGVLRPHELAFLFCESEREQVAPPPSCRSPSRVCTACWRSAAPIRSTTRARWAPCSSATLPKSSRAPCRASPRHCARYADLRNAVSCQPGCITGSFPRVARSRSGILSGTPAQRAPGVRAHA